MAALSGLLRDHRTGDVYSIDIGVIHILWTLRQVFDNAAAYEVISCYRSPATNAELSPRGREVAKRSHCKQGPVERRCLFFIHRSYLGSVSASDHKHQKIIKKEATTTGLPFYLCCASGD